MARKLRIAIIAPIAMAIEPNHTGSIEQLVHLLTEEFVRREHDVTLFASGDSRTSARLCATYPRGWLDDPDLEDYQFREAVHVATAFERAHEFDVIQSHDYEYALPFAGLTRTPLVTTFHIMPHVDAARLCSARPYLHTVAISHWQRRELAAIPHMDVIHHGIDTDAFAFGRGDGGYLLFLGRVIDSKGPLEAIEVARRTGMRLIMAGGGDYYLEHDILPLVDGDQIRYVGHVEHAERNVLLGDAAALLFPLVYPEPFGLVMIEAMACGTPVLGLDCGAVAEIVDAGVTGYYATGVDGMVDLLPATLGMDRARVRREGVKRFDFRRMADEYEALYLHLACAGERTGAQ